MEAIEQLTPHIYTLAQFSQASAAKSVLSVIREKYEEFQRRPKSGVRPELVSELLTIAQGDPSASGQRLYFFDFDLRVPPCCLYTRHANSARFAE